MERQLEVYVRARRTPAVCCLAPSAPPRPLLLPHELSVPMDSPPPRPPVPFIFLSFLPFKAGRPHVALQRKAPLTDIDLLIAQTHGLTPSPPPPPPPHQADSISATLCTRTACNTDARLCAHLMLSQDLDVPLFCWHRIFPPPAFPSDAPGLTHNWVFCFCKDMRRSRGPFILLPRILLRRWVMSRHFLTFAGCCFFFFYPAFPLITSIARGCPLATNLTVLISDAIEERIPSHSPSRCAPELNQTFHESPKLIRPSSAPAMTAAVTIGEKGHFIVVSFWEDFIWSRTNPEGPSELSADRQKSR